MARVWELETIPPQYHCGVCFGCLQDLQGADMAGSPETSPHLPPVLHFPVSAYSLPPVLPYLQPSSPLPAHSPSSTGVESRRGVSPLPLPRASPLFPGGAVPGLLESLSPHLSSPRLLPAGIRPARNLSALLPRRLGPGGAGDPPSLLACARFRSPGGSPGRRAPAARVFLGGGQVGGHYCCGSRRRIPQPRWRARGGTGWAGGWGGER